MIDDMTTTWTITSDSGTERTGTASTRLDAAAEIGTVLREIVAGILRDRFIVTVDGALVAVLKVDAEMDDAGLESTYQYIDHIESAIAT